MASFASANLSAQSAYAAYLSSTAAANGASTGAGTTEGTNKLTFVVPVSGLYKISSSLNVVTVSTAGTSHTLAAFVSYNNGTAITSATIAESGVTPSTINLLAAGGGAGTALTQTKTIYAVAGTSIVMNTVDTVTGTGTGTTNIQFAIVGI